MAFTTSGGNRNEALRARLNVLAMSKYYDRLSSNQPGSLTNGIKEFPVVIGAGRKI